MVDEELQNSCFKMMFEYWKGFLAANRKYIWQYNTIILHTILRSRTSLFSFLNKIVKYDYINVMEIGVVFIHARTHLSIIIFPCNLSEIMTCMTCH